MIAVLSTATAMVVLRSGLASQFWGCGVAMVAMIVSVVYCRQYFRVTGEMVGRPAADEDTHAVRGDDEVSAKTA